MNSPPDPGSPSVSTPSSSSPPPEEVNTNPSNASRIMDLASHITSSFSSSSKRRLPGGSSFGSSSSNRDHKTRRRGDSGRLAASGGSGANWEGLKEGKREKEDLIDHHIVEYLRKEIGDPFQDVVLKRSS